MYFIASRSDIWWPEIGKHGTDVSEKVFVVVILYQGLRKHRQKENTDNSEQSWSPMQLVPTADLAATGVRGVKLSFLAALASFNVHFIYGMFLFCGFLASVVKWSDFMELCLSLLSRF